MSQVAFPQVASSQITFPRIIDARVDVELSADGDPRSSRRMDHRIRAMCGPEWRRIGQNRGRIGHGGAIERPSRGRPPAKIGEGSTKIGE